MSKKDYNLLKHFEDIKREILLESEFFIKISKSPKIKYMLPSFIEPTSIQISRIQIIIDELHYYNFMDGGLADNLEKCIESGVFDIASQEYDIKKEQYIKQIIRNTTSIQEQILKYHEIDEIHNFSKDFLTGLDDKIKQDSEEYINFKEFYLKIMESYFNRLEDGCLAEQFETHMDTNPHLLKNKLGRGFFDMESQEFEIKKEQDIKQIVKRINSIKEQALKYLKIDVRHDSVNGFLTRFDDKIKEFQTEYILLSKEYKTMMDAHFNHFENGGLAEQLETYMDTNQHILKNKL